MKYHININTNNEKVIILVNLDIENPRLVRLHY